MVCSHSRLFRPAGGATWVRRIGAGGRSALRSFASKGAKLKERQRHDKDQRTAPRKQKIGIPIGYSLIAVRSKKLLDLNVRFADLVVMAERLHPIPFRTRP